MPVRHAYEDTECRLAHIQVSEQCFVRPTHVLGRMLTYSPTRRSQTSACEQEGTTGVAMSPLPFFAQEPLATCQVRVPRQVSCEGGLPPSQGSTGSEWYALLFCNRLRRLTNDQARPPTTTPAAAAMANDAHAHSRKNLPSILYPKNSPKC